MLDEIKNGTFKLHHRGPFGIAQSIPNPFVYCAVRYNNLSDKSGWVRGLIRVLGREGRADMPSNKKHELFIPYPDAAERAAVLPIPTTVLRNFETLARERAEVTVGDAGQPRNRLPYLPFDTSTRELESWEAKNGRLVPKLKDGDLVYFDVEADAQGAPRVSAISFSAIWRDGVRRDDRSLASMHDFFDSKLRP